MKKCFGGALIWVMVGLAGASGQQKALPATTPARLQLTADVAATTEEGYPALLRITLTNVGDSAVDLPMPTLACSSADGGLNVSLIWTPIDGAPGMGSGCAGWQSDRPPLLNRARDEWIRLQPGEFIVASESLRPRLSELGPGTVEYWVEYTPPAINPSEMVELAKAGYVVPTEKIATAHESFEMH